jgi:16S rRNA processing protein RimM
VNAAGSAARRVVLGRITGVFGIKGWVKVQSFTDPAESILNFREWQLEQRAARRAVEVREGRRHGTQVVAHLESFDDRDAAATLIGSEISVARESLPPLAAREYYQADLLGLTVRDAEGVVLGRIDHFVDAPANPVMVVVGEGRELWVPAVPPYLRRVDLAAGEVLVDWQPGEAPEGQNE